jgi:7,8-dihydropterin-6-yl-methyl-4-(beta-D-ribofuranosyl)aminobenzene 5'-phosphate synthase
MSTDPSVRITVLVDDRADPPLEAEHGLSLWIEALGHKVLFDSGAGRALGPNARVLGIDPTAADVVVLSHGHFDHGGGLPSALGGWGSAPVFLHPAALEPKYDMADGALVPAGLPGPAARALAALSPDRVRRVTGPLELWPGIGLTGPVPRESEFERSGGSFFLDPEGRCPDPLEDDQALWIAAPAGLVVCAGCAHAGIVNTLRFALRVSGAASVRAVVGGFHLLEAGKERIARTVKALEGLGVEVVAPCHCSGERAAARLRGEFGRGFIPVSAGKQLSF